MRNKTVGVLAIMGLVLGVAGFGIAGCSLESGGTLGVDDDQETADSTRVDNIVPAEEEGLSPNFLQQLGADH